MSYKRKAKEKPDLSKNPDHVIDTKYGRDLLLSGKVKILDKYYMKD